MCSFTCQSLSLLAQNGFTSLLLPPFPHSHSSSLHPCVSSPGSFHTPTSLYSTLRKKRSSPWLLFLHVPPPSYPPPDCVVSLLSSVLYSSSFLAPSIFQPLFPADQLFLSTHAYFSLIFLPLCSFIKTPIQSPLFLPLPSCTKTHHLFPSPPPFYSPLLRLKPNYLLF